MMFIYPAIFHKEDNSFWVDFPDLLGCQTFGDTLPETISLAQEALAGYLLTLLEEGREIAPPSDIKSLVCDENSFSTLVSCDLSKYSQNKSVKKTLTIPSWLNERAVAMGINFSQALQDALINKIQSA